MNKNRHHPEAFYQLETELSITDPETLTKLRASVDSGKPWPDPQVVAKLQETVNSGKSSAEPLGIPAASDKP